MPDLTLQGTHQYWKQYPDPMIYRVLAFMESVENYPGQEDDSLQSALKELGEALDRLDTIDLAKLGQETIFLLIGNHLKMTQTLRLLQALDTAHPGSAAKLLMYAEKTRKQSEAISGLFLQRNMIFERLRLLARIFAPDRLNQVRDALQDE